MIYVMEKGHFFRCDARVESLFGGVECFAFGRGGGPPFVDGGGGKRSIGGEGAGVGVA